MKKLAVFASVLLLSIVFTPAGSAEKRSLLYATIWPFPPSQLATIDLNTETVTVIGDTEFTDSAALAICPGGVAYSITNIFEEPSPSHLAILNLDTGTETQVGSPIPPGLDMMALECSRSGILYAIGGSDPTNSDYNTLYVINRVTGQLYRLGSTRVNDGLGDDMFMALRFAPNGELYGANTSALYRINRITGRAVKVVEFSDNVKGNVMGLAIDDDENFYLADYTAESHVYALDTRTGRATSILDTKYASVHSIAFKTPD
jgi:DNA-binding beta-propeller fold protein YncE